MARLLLTQKVSRSADFQIVEGDLKAPPQLIDLLKGVESFLCVPRHDPFSWNQQIGIGPAGGTAHTAAELIELRQPEPVRPVDENRVGVGEIDTRFDNG